MPIKSGVEINIRQDIFHFAIHQMHAAFYAELERLVNIFWDQREVRHTKTLLARHGPYPTHDLFFLNIELGIFKGAKIIHMVVVRMCEQHVVYIIW